MYQTNDLGSVSVIIGHPVIKSNNFFVLFTGKYEKMCDPNSLFQLKEKNALQLCKTLGIWLEEIRNPKKFELMYHITKVQELNTR